MKTVFIIPLSYKKPAFDSRNIPIMSVTTNRIKAAVIQAEPVWFDLAGAVTKTCHLIKDAASEGAHIIAFPELWLPGYLSCMDLVSVACYPVE